MKKDPMKSMRDFVAKYDRLIKSIPKDVMPPTNNLKRFFIISLQPEVGFFLRRSQPRDLKEAQYYAIEIEDDLIFS
ncbi:hypothetical protein KI387_024080, partial [Taxus chinensis]